MPAELPGGDARFDESDDDGEFEGFTAADIEASADRIRNRQLSADFVRESDDDFDVSDISSLDSGSDADVDDDSIRAKPWTTTLENPPDIPFATAALGVVNSVFCSSLSAVELFNALLHRVHSAGDRHGNEHLRWPVHEQRTTD